MVTFRPHLRLRPQATTDSLSSPMKRSMIRQAWQSATISRLSSTPLPPSIPWGPSAISTPATYMTPRRSGSLQYSTQAFDRKGDIHRDSKYKTLSEDDVRFFKSILGSDNALIDGISRDAAAELEAFNRDWMGKYCGRTDLVLKPDSTQQVSQILRYCNNNMIAVTPQGGNTGLAGGSVPVFDEVVLNLSRFKGIRSFDSVSGVLVAEAGVILQEADEHVKQYGCIFPLDLGAKGSCQIGGNIATNAGGLRLLRYGSLHGNVVGLEVVLPDGTIMDNLSELRKDNTGYDLKHLFIGSEGTLGIVTACSILCPQRPASVNVAYFGLASFEDVVATFKEAKAHLGETLSAFELMDSNSQTLYAHTSGNKLPLDSTYPFYCLVETSGANSEHDSEKLDNFLEFVMSKGIVSDGVIAQDESQIQDLWACREGISEASQHFGGVYKYDVSIPLANMYDLVQDTRSRMKDTGLMGNTDDLPVIDVVGYGHIGDFNLHVNVAVRRWDKRVEQTLEPFIYEWIHQHNGSISAEHGLGLAKKDFVRYSKSGTMLQLMKQIK